MMKCGASSLSLHAMHVLESYCCACAGSHFEGLWFGFEAQMFHTEVLLVEEQATGCYERSRIPCRSEAVGIVLLSVCSVS
jgi:hypothetical protein